MNPVIVVQDGGTDTGLRDIVATLEKTGIESISVYTASFENCSSVAGVFSPAEFTLGDAIKRSLGERDERISIILSSARATPQEIADALKRAEDETTGLNIITAGTDPVGMDISDITADSIIPALIRNTFNGAAIINVSARLVRSLPEGQPLSNAGGAIFLAVAAAANGEEISVDASISGNGMIQALTNSERADILRYAISECNIEDLFPNHPWHEFEEESLSSCYHTLAAIFIKLGDMESATECLNISEQFEDSPRLLALRGIVASSQGRTLEAVANLVSSLQQYEERKKNTGDHYLSFAPGDIEIINVDLKDGLEALNQRDNQRAFECFSKAIFQFDTFFNEIGIASVN